MGVLGASLSASGLGDLELYEGRFLKAVQLLEEGAARDIAAKSADRAAAKLAGVAYARLLQDPDPEVHEPAALHWCEWEDTHVATYPGYTHDDRYDDDRLYDDVSAVATASASQPGRRVGR